MLETVSAKVKHLIFFVLLIGISQSLNGQSTEYRKAFFGQIVDMFNSQPIMDAHIINLSTSKGTISNYKGEFRIDVAVGDTLYVSEMGFHSKKFTIEKANLNQNNIIKLVTQNYNLNEVIVTPYDLTGILEIDVKNIVALNERRVVKVGNLKTSGELGKNQYEKPSIMQPVDFIYNIFGKRPKELRKLKKLKEQDQIRDLLYYKYDREFLMEMLNLSRKQIDAILKYCQYDPDQILQANDLQILQAVLDCYDEYKKFYDLNGEEFKEEASPEKQ